MHQQCGALQFLLSEMFGKSPIFSHVVGNFRRHQFSSHIHCNRPCAISRDWCIEYIVDKVDISTKIKYMNCCMLI